MTTINQIVEFFGSEQAITVSSIKTILDENASREMLIGMCQLAALFWSRNIARAAVKNRNMMTLDDIPLNIVAKATMCADQVNRIQ